MTDALPFPSAPDYGAVPQYPIESVDNALKVLLLLRERPDLRLTDVSSYLGVASSTAHRLLAMLQYRGFVQRDNATRNYVAGPAMDALAYGVLRRLDVRARARPVLEQLNVDLEETVHLGRLEGRDVHFIDSIESARALRVAGRLGRHMPAHCTSTGKALLSKISKEDLALLYPDEELPKVTPRSIGTRTELMAALAEISAQGYARSQEESEEGVSSVAVALDSVRSPRLALNAAVPATRMDDANLAKILSRLIVAAQELDHLLV